MPSIRSACPQCETPLQDTSTLFCPKCSFPLMLIAGKYRLERALEKGGFGTVYLAHHTGLTRDTERVIKVVESGMFAEEESQIRFRREVELTSSLSQRNNHIVRIYDDFGREPELGYYYVMEYLRGKPLSHVMCPGKPLHAKLIFLMMEQLCSALDAAHREHIVHRDLKPPNIFLIERDKNPCFVKILDFGIAKPITEHSKGLTRHILGTPHYMSPEQCLNEPVDARSDLYALGMLFYHMSTGTHPYKNLKAGSDFAVMQAQISQPPTSMREKRPDLDIPEELEKVVLKAIEKEANDRFPTAGAFWAALRPFAPAPSSPSELHGLLSAAIAVRAVDMRRRQAPPRPPTVSLGPDDELSAMQEEEDIPVPPSSEDAFASIVPPSSPASFEMLDAVEKAPPSDGAHEGISSPNQASLAASQSNGGAALEKSEPARKAVSSSAAGALMIMEPANSIRETTQDVPLEMFGLLQPSEDTEEERARIAKLREAMRSISTERLDDKVVPRSANAHPSSPSLDSLSATVPVSINDDGSSPHAQKPSGKAALLDVSGGAVTLESPVFSEAQEEGLLEEPPQRGRSWAMLFLLVAFALVAAALWLQKERFFPAQISAVTPPHRVVDPKPQPKVEPRRMVEPRPQPKVEPRRAVVMPPIRKPDLRKDPVKVPSPLPRRGIEPRTRVVLVKPRLPEPKVTIFARGGAHRSGAYKARGILGTWRRVAWRKKTRGNVNTSPLVVGDIAYFGSDDGFFYALQVSDGEVMWRRKIGARIASSPLVMDDMVYFGAWDHSLYALRRKDGSTLWHHKTKGAIDGSPAADRDRVYFGSDDYHIYAVDRATGKLVWKYKTGRLISASPALVGGSLYVGGHDGSLYAMDTATGKQRWSFKTKGRIAGGPAVVRGIVYFGSSDQHVYAVDALTGKQRWVFETGGEITGSPAIAHGVLYIGSHDGSLYAVDAATGGLRWRYRTRGKILSSPSVYGRVVVFKSQDRYLYGVSTRTHKRRWRVRLGLSWAGAAPVPAHRVVLIGTLRPSGLWAIK